MKISGAKLEGLSPAKDMTASCHYSLWIMASL